MLVPSTMLNFMIQAAEQGLAVIASHACTTYQLATENEIAHIVRDGQCGGNARRIFSSHQS